MEVRIDYVGGNVAIVRFYQKDKFIGRADCEVSLDGTIKLVSHNQHSQIVHTTLGNIKYCEKD